MIEAGRDWSVVFRLETPIPQEKLRTASLYKFSFAQQQAALRRMMRRVGMPGCEYLRLSECAAIGTNFGEQRFARRWLLQFDDRDFSRIQYGRMG